MLAAFVVAGGSVPDTAVRVGIRPSIAKRRLADLRARSGLTTELVVPSLEPVVSAHSVDDPPTE